jgi:hypothetical protein
MDRNETITSCFAAAAFAVFIFSTGSCVARQSEATSAQNRACIARGGHVIGTQSECIQGVH